MGKRTKIANGFGLTSKLSAILTLGALISFAVHLTTRAAQTPKSQDVRIPVHYTDVRKEAGITFLQDATQTEEKYYLETMGTGVAWS